ncbi:MAG: hypothetical protein U9M90_02485 [Patescibacteria group bacterium]|nr:hypothetical protein [Patescibacteria group bacterium]
MMTSLNRVLDFAEEKMVVQKAMGKTKKVVKCLIDAPQEAYFRVHNGSALRNLKDLHKALRGMTKEQFEYHTKRNGNDFARWIKDVLGEKALASKITRLRSKKGIQNAIEKFLKK